MISRLPANSGFRVTRIAVNLVSFSALARGVVGGGVMSKVAKGLFPAYGVAGVKGASYQETAIVGSGYTFVASQACCETHELLSASACLPSSTSQAVNID